jgi:hypothetical protein
MRYSVLPSRKALPQEIIFRPALRRSFPPDGGERFFAIILLDGQLTEQCPHLLPDKVALPEKVMHLLCWDDQLRFCIWPLLNSLFQGDHFQLSAELPLSQCLFFLAENCPDLSIPGTWFTLLAKAHDALFMAQGVSPDLALPNGIRCLKESESGPSDPLALQIFHVSDQASVAFHRHRGHCQIGFVDAPFGFSFWGFDEIVQGVFHSGENVDFAGVRTFFQLLALAPSFRPDVVGTFYDNDPRKEGLELFGIPILPLGCASRAAASAKICHSLMNRGLIEPKIRD